MGSLDVGGRRGARDLFHKSSAKLKHPSYDSKHSTFDKREQLTASSPKDATRQGRWLHPWVAAPDGKAHNKFPGKNFAARQPTLPQKS